MENYNLGRFRDSKPMEFDGDIIITDPCYVMKEDDDWERCDYGDDMEALGIEHFMTRETIYGDWSCTVFDTDTKKPIGEFCADAGLVSVMLLDEVLRYNPDFDYHEKRTWTTTLIQDFKGIVQFIVKKCKFFYNGKDCVNYEVRVVGHGVNKVTGEPINFESKQTGL